eukprot:CAMPEP_0201556618 /NCGR_PEP_ID=MMETSP0173_2-20130828/56644_1 /ASSEMBLY_ACC=CAM_ASM_000268 /TAXON_ID=218659 /ORGANISM="Vexillifera sp., Strain DIVA3 564/2" /LENGTH=251 /DNA_ID=CAMNT_0047968997 /DNA_START=200 /DNA_END=951 /DNA_ORIENTATION=-
MTSTFVKSAAAYYRWFSHIEGHASQYSASIRSNMEATLGKGSFDTLNKHTTNFGDCSQCSPLSDQVMRREGGECDTVWVFPTEFLCIDKKTDRLWLPSHIVDSPTFFVHLVVNRQKTLDQRKKAFTSNQKLCLDCETRRSIEIYIVSAIERVLREKIQHQQRIEAYRPCCPLENVKPKKKTKRPIKEIERKKNVGRKSAQSMSLTPCHCDDQAPAVEKGDDDQALKVVEKGVVVVQPKVVGTSSNDQWIKV